MSENEKHTSGPWAVDWKSATATVRSLSGLSVARCYQGDADAALISAAPDLLAAAQDAQAAIESAHETLFKNLRELFSSSVISDDEINSLPEMMELAGQLVPLELAIIKATVEAK